MEPRAVVSISQRALLISLAGIALALIVGAVVLLILSGGTESTTDASELRACVDRDLGAESGTSFGESPAGPFADANTVFNVSGRTETEALEFGFDLVEVYVFDDSETAEDAEAEAAGDAGDLERNANVVWVVSEGSIPSSVSTGIRNCIGEAS